MSCQHTSMEGGKCYDCDYCLHEVIYGGLCAVCGQFVDSNEETDNNEHIDINHKTTGIKVSKKEAERLEKEDEKRLLKEKKLSLIIDLDQTILHAAWEPHIAQWVDDNKNDKRAKEMSTFSLDSSPNKYTIKLRPGLRPFLNEISKYYEMHIYTMGTRAYADAVMKVIDPTGSLFHDRILSRDENGSMTKKKLERLFPSDQTKVVILDDRADVWDYSPNLIQMKPYEYFAGIGDINAPPTSSDEITRQAATENVTETNDTSESATTEETSNAPEAQSDNQEIKKEEDTNEENKNEENDNEPSTPEPEEHSDDGSSSDTSSVGSATKPSDKSSNNEEVPIIKDELKDTTNGEVATNNKVTNTPMPAITINGAPSNQQFTSEYATNPSYTPKSHDPDNILPIIKNVLLQVHEEYFTEIDKNSNAKPNVANILGSLKSQILNACCIVFSGVIPLQCRPEDSSIWRMATSFGAKCLSELTGKVTHLVAATVGTSKVNTARKYSSIKIVSPSWLTNSAWEWKKQDEQDYLMALPREGSVASEIENPEESSLDFEDEKLDMDWDDSEVDAALESSDDDGESFNGSKHDNNTQGTDENNNDDDHENDNEDDDGNNSDNKSENYSEVNEEDNEEQTENEHQPNDSQRAETDGGDEEDFDDDWLAAELGDNDDDNEGEVEGYSEEDDDSEDMDEDQLIGKRKRDSDFEEDEYDSDHSSKKR